MKESSAPNLFPWHVDGHLHAHMVFSLCVYLTPDFSFYMNTSNTELATPNDLIFAQLSLQRSCVQIRSHSKIHRYFKRHNSTHDNYIGKTFRDNIIPSRYF